MRVWEDGISQKTVKNTTIGKIVLNVKEQGGYLNMSYNLDHKEYTITIKFVSWEALSAQVLEEIRQLRLHIQGNALSNKRSCFDHVSDLRLVVDSKPL